MVTFRCDYDCMNDGKCHIRLCYLAATAPQKKAVTLVKEIKKQQMELENLNVAQVTTDFAVNDMKNVVTKMKQQEKKEEKRLKKYGAYGPYITSP